MAATLVDDAVVFLDFHGSEIAERFFEQGSRIEIFNLGRSAGQLVDDQDVFSAFFRWQRNFYP
jgi:hypothetical protein